MKRTYEEWLPIVYKIYIEELKRLFEKRLLEDIGIKDKDDPKKNTPKER